MQMRSIGTPVWLILYFLVLSSCKKEQSPTSLDITIIEHPLGGERVTSLNLKMDIELAGDKKDINVNVEWWGQPSLEKKLLYVSTHLVDSKIITSINSSFAAPEGYYFFGAFWAEINWTDDLGQHFLFSDTALCLPPLK